MTNDESPGKGALEQLGNEKKKKDPESLRHVQNVACALMVRWGRSASNIRAFLGISLASVLTGTVANGLCCRTLTAKIG